jgi:hypothetical protein
MKFSYLTLGLVASEMYSDITLPADFQEKQLRKRHDQFWKVIEEAVDTEDYVGAVEGLFACASELPDGPTKPLLEQSLTQLEAAAAAAAAQNGRAVGAAEAALTAGSQAQARGATDFFTRLYRTFVAEDQGERPDKFRAQVEERQKRVAGILKGAVHADVVKSTHAAARLAFDVLKYDIYHAGAPTTPEDAKDIANKIVDLHAKVRKSFLGPITAMANEIAEDASSFLAPRLRHVPAVEKQLRAIEAAESRDGQLEVVSETKTTV